MCTKPKTPKVEPMELPTAPATPPPPEQVAEAPVVGSEKASHTKEKNAKKSGTSALKVDLATGGSAPLKGNGLSIPRA